MTLEYVEANRGLIETPEEIARLRAIMENWAPSPALTLNFMRLCDSHEALRAASRAEKPESESWYGPSDIDRWYREGVAAAQDEGRSPVSPYADLAIAQHWWQRGFQWMAANLDRARLRAASRAEETPAPPTWEEIRKLPSPWGCVTSGANPQPDGGMTPPLWHCHCRWCDARASVKQWRYPVAEGHPDTSCLWARAHAEPR
jgi:hypothetical protein